MSPIVAALADAKPADIKAIDDRIMQIDDEKKMATAEQEALRKVRSILWARFGIRKPPLNPGGNTLPPAKKEMAAPTPGLAPVVNKEPPKGATEVDIKRIANFLYAEGIACRPLSIADKTKLGSNVVVNALNHPWFRSKSGGFELSDLGRAAAEKF